MSSLGLILASPLADRFGIHFWFVLGGLMTIVIGVAAFFIPPIMNIEGVKVS